MSFVLLLNTRYLPTDSYKHHSHYPGLILVEDNPRHSTHGVAYNRIAGQSAERPAVLVQFEYAISPRLGRVRASE